MFTSREPYIVGIGGTPNCESVTERILRLSLDIIEQMGGRTSLIGGAQLDFPIYAYGAAHRGASVQKFIAEIRRADGIIFATPSYHGNLSGLMKNAIDYIEDTSHDESPYLDGKVIGCIVTAAGWQSAASTLNALRTTVHALRGWPTPYGVTVNTAPSLFDHVGNCTSSKLIDDLSLQAGQILDFSRMRAAREVNNKSETSSHRSAPAIPHRPGRRTA